MTLYAAVEASTSRSEFIPSEVLVSVTGRSHWTRRAPCRTTWSTCCFYWWRRRAEWVEPWALSWSLSSWRTWWSACSYGAWGEISPTNQSSSSSRCTRCWLVRPSSRCYITNRFWSRLWCCSRPAREQRRLRRVRFISKYIRNHLIPSYFLLSLVQYLISLSFISISVSCVFVVLSFDIYLLCSFFYSFSLFSSVFFVIVWVQPLFHPSFILYLFLYFSVLVFTDGSVNICRYSCPVVKTKNEKIHGRINLLLNNELMNNWQFNLIYIIPPEFLKLIGQNMSVLLFL